MSMQSYVLVICNYAPEIKDHLDYGSHFYNDTKLGAIVTKRLFYCDTTSQSRELANYFLKVDEWDFNQHDVTTRLFQIYKMTREEFDDSFGRADYFYIYEQDMEDLITLMPYIKLAIFMPEG